MNSKILVASGFLSESGSSQGLLIHYAEHTKLSLVTEFDCMFLLQLCKLTRSTGPQCHLRSEGGLRAAMGGEAGRLISVSGRSLDITAIGFAIPASMPGMKVVRSVVGLFTAPTLITTRRAPSAPSKCHTVSVVAQRLASAC